MEEQVLFIDDDPRAGDLFMRFCQDASFSVQIFRDPRGALERFRDGGVDLIVTDLSMPAMSGLDLLAAVREADAEIPVIIITAYSSVDSAIQALRLGATDFIKKPYDPEEMLRLVQRNLEHRRLQQENRLLRRQLSDERLRYGLVGSSPAMQAVYQVIDKVADLRCHVLVEGESGTGKELVARALHGEGSASSRPFVVIDCGALTDTLLDSELFGHHRGAVPEAGQAKQGLLQAASGGTVLLDEVGHISEPLQVKLLRAIQEQQVTPAGAVRPVDIDVRFIAATNRSLESLVQAGAFREDLYHRLNVVRIRVPPLRERRDDIPRLVQHFVDELGQRYGRTVSGFDRASLEHLQALDWPGNVRQLRNTVERHVALAEGSSLVLQDALLDDMTAGAGIDADMPDLETLQRRYVLKLLAYFQGSRERTAAALGINKSTLWRRLRQYRTEG